MTITDDRTKRGTVYCPLIERAAEAVLRHENVPDTAEISVSIVEPDEIRRLNAKWRGVDAVTDVLSFPQDDGENLLGDIVICLDRALEQAAEYGHSARREMAFLTVHGALHLLGYDHENEESERVMFGLQEEILNILGVERNE